MIKKYYDTDCNLGFLDGKTVAIMGYGSQGHAHAQNLHESGVDVVVGLRKDSASWAKAEAAGLKVMEVPEAAKAADVVMMLVPDEIAADIYNEQVAPYMKEGDVLMFAHGFNIHFQFVKPAKNIDVIMVAPKGPGTEVRRVFEEGFGCPGLIAVHQNPSGKARDVALAMAKAEGLTRGGVLECTMAQETYEDLFGEQNVLCGGLVDLMKYGFETLTEAGYPPEMAYFECVHEAKLIVDLIYNGGIQKMNSVISNTAEFGEYYNGPQILPAEVKERMKESLKRIESGKFAKDWLEEAAKGAPNLKAKREALGQHPVEIVGAKIRSLFERN